MTIILKGGKVAFVHIPKTGGTWVRECLKLNNLVEQEILEIDLYNTTEATHETQHSVPLTDSQFMRCDYVFSFVRNPLTWYQSYWAFKSSYRWYVGKRFDKNTASRIFSDFITKVQKHYPQGYLSSVFKFYTDICTHVGQQENLQDGLVHFLEIYGFDTGSLIFPDRIKISPVENKNIATYKVGQIEPIIELERKVFNDYSYSTNPNHYRHLQSSIW